MIEWRWYSDKEQENEWQWMWKNESKWERMMKKRNRNDNNLLNGKNMEHNISSVCLRQIWKGCMLQRFLSLAHIARPMRNDLYFVCCQLPVFVAFYLYLYRMAWVLALRGFFSASISFALFLYWYYFKPVNLIIFLINFRSIHHRIVPFHRTSDGIFPRKCQSLFMWQRCVVPLMSDTGE